MLAGWLSAPAALACEFCRPQVEAGIFNGQFLGRLGLTLLPLLVLLVIVVLIVRDPRHRIGRSTSQVPEMPPEGDRWSGWDA